MSALANRQHGAISRKQLLAAGLGSRTIRRWLEAGRLYQIHSDVYAFGREDVAREGRWLAAVLTGGEGAVLSHRSAATLWGMASHDLPVDVTVARAKRKPDVLFHECGLRRDEWQVVDGIPVTSPERALLDFAELTDEREVGRAFEEGDRRRLLKIKRLELVCARGYGRRGVKALRPLLEAARPPATRSPLEDQVRALCRDHNLPQPQTNVVVLGKEVDAFWPDQKLMVEADSFEFHHHRAAFERDRARDAAMQVAGYRVVRLTHRRIEEESAKVAAQLRHLLTR